MGLKIKNSKNIVTDGLILHLDASDKLSYSGSGTTWKDRSSNGYDGTLVNGPTFDSANGGSIEFDGSNDRVDIPNSPLLSSHSNNETSVCAWVRADTFLDDPIIYIRNGLGEQHQDFIALGFRTDGRIRARLRLLVGGITNTRSFNSTSTVSVNQWMFVCFTYDGSDVNIYKNGVSFYQTSLSGTMQDSSTSAKSMIGLDEDPPPPDPDYDQFFNGKVSEVFCYDKALTSLEVKRNYDATKGRF